MSDGAKSRQEEIEDRKQWRTISRRTTTLTITYNNGARRLFWFEEPEGFRPEEGRLPAGVILHGPFRTEAEVKKDIRLTILGPQCKVIEGGEWDPNWDKPQ
jgi:hypothetical protein